MKNKYYLFIALIGVIFSSCSDFLSKDSEDLLIPATVSDLSEFLQGEAYPNIGKTMFKYIDLITDDIGVCAENDHIAKSYKSYYTWQKEMEKQLEGEMIADNVWSNLYKVIKIANVTLSQINEVEGGEKARAFVKGESHFIRAYCYFLLVNLYGNPYDVSSSNSDLGVPINLNEGIEDKLFKRNTVKEVYDQVWKDLNEAKVLFDEADMESTIFHANTDACYFLMSRVALYQKDWENVIKYSGLVLKNHSALEDISGEDYKRERFFTKSNPEIIFSYCDETDVNTKVDEMDASGELLNLLGSNDNRRVAFIINYRGFYSGIRTNNPYKYRDYYMVKGVYVHNFRVAEMYLNRAEAFEAKNMVIEAKNDIEYLRAHRLKTPETIPDNIDLKQFIRDERRRELCFEMQRWFDLRRWGRPRIEHIYTIYDDDHNVIGTEKYVLEQGDQAYTLQLPYSVRQFNPSMEVNERPDRPSVSSDN